MSADVRTRGNPKQSGTEDFVNQNGREGWMLPETLGSAKQPQPVANRPGPRSALVAHPRRFRGGCGDP